MVEGRREQLLDAAERVILRKGLTSATVSDVTTEAGVAKGTFYLYFSTKDDVVRALQARMYEFLLQRIAEAYASATDGDWWTQVDQVLEAIVDFDVEHGDWHRLVMQSTTAPADMRRHEQQIIGALTAAISKGVEEGAFAADDPEMFAVMLFHAGQGVSHHAIMSDEGPSRERLLRAMQGFFRQALSPAPRG